MIPKIIHQFWAGGPCPDEFLEYSAGWQALHPDWVTYLWDTSVAHVLGSFCRRLCEEAPLISPYAYQQFRSDVLRYHLLETYGGVWVDMDLEPQLPIDSLCEGVSAWACWEEDDTWVGSSILAAERGHPWISHLLDRLQYNHRLKEPVTANTKKTGPQFITKLTRYRDDVKLYPSHYFFPYKWNELERKGQRFPASFAIHHWNHKRSLERVG
jgi:mannosyltransferase OCH1-like enzyme